MGLAWRVPTLLPIVYVRHPGVTQYLTGGADLMLPGTVIPPEVGAFGKGKLFAVAVQGRALLFLSSTWAVVASLSTHATYPLLIQSEVRSS